MQILVFLILVISTALRIYLFPTNNTWLGDIGRDMLAGHLIAYEGANTSQGHFNSGMGFSVYPSFYYYFIAIITKIGGDNFDQIKNLLIFYQSLGAIILFFILKGIFSKATALVTSLFYVFAIFSINFSLSPISAHNSVPIALFSLLMLLAGCKKNSLTYLSLGGLFLVLAATFFYGAVLLMPLYFFTIIIYFWQKEEKNYIKGVAYGGYYVIFFCLSLIVAFSATTSFSNALEVLFRSGIRQLQLSSINWSELAIDLREKFAQLHPIFTNWFYLIYAMVLALAIKKRKTRNYALLFTGFFILHIILYALHQGKLGHYLIYLNFILIFGLAFALENIKNVNKLLFIFSSFLIIYSSGITSVEKSIDNNERYEHYLLVSEVVSKHFPEKRISSWENCEDSSYGKKRWQYENDTWESRSYWYFQRNNNWFILSDMYSQISSINKQIIYLCFLTEDQLNSGSNTDYLLADQPVITFHLEGKVYFAYDGQ